jgi:Uma2 family endonuclease
MLTDIPIEPSFQDTPSEYVPMVALVRTSEQLRTRLHRPRTYEQRVHLGVRELRVPATFEEYLELAEEADYRVQYREGQIISFIEIDEKTNTIMGEATIPHEILVARFIRFLSELLDDEPQNYSVLGSNAKLFIAEDKKGFNADVTIIKGEPIEKHYKYNKRTSKGIANPWLLVEILSNSTRDFDLSEKLNDYKKIETLHQIIFAEQGSVWVTTYIRVNQTEWRNLDFTNLEDKIPVLDKFLSLEKIFGKIFGKG